MGIPRHKLTAALRQPLPNDIMGKLIGAGEREIPLVRPECLPHWQSSAAPSFPTPPARLPTTHYMESTRGGCVNG